MSAADTPFEVTLEQQRSRLTGLAYRMLGSFADAEDVLQEAWMRWQRLDAEGRAAIERPEAWLTTTVSRLALDRLKSAQRQRETYVGPWLPEPVLRSPDPADAVELSESLTLGFLAVLERLGPVERAVFLLADVFGEPYASIAAVVGRSEEACRQTAHRARVRVRSERPRFEPPGDGASALMAAFMDACLLGDIDRLRDVLSDDVVLVSDGGADRHAARRPVVGFDRVARFMVNITKRVPSDATISVQLVNGEPGVLVSRGGQPWYVMAFGVVGGRVATIHTIVNPDKLRHVEVL